MKSQKFYTLNPEFYKELWSSSKSSNQNLKPKDFEYKLKKALSGWHDRLLFDSAFLNNPFFDSYIQKALDQKIKPALQITNFQKNKNRIAALIKAYPELEVHLILQDHNQVEDFKLISQNGFLVYVVTKKNYKKILQGPQKRLLKSWLYFPYKTKLWDSFLSLTQIYRFIKKWPQVSVYPVDIYDKRIPKDMDLEPITQAFSANRLPDSDIDFSIVIPCYNSEKQIPRTLKALSLQNYPRNQYELIVVDDGSSDNTRKQIQNFIQDHPALNIQGIHFPRVIEKQKNSARFRAGLARNLGVKHSSGKILAFLDSDILTPQDYLIHLKKEHQKADVVLLKRYHLKSERFLDDLFFKEITNSVYIENKKYWGAFYEKGFDQVSCPWKYTCTYGLSLFKKDFLSVGAFGKNFLFYGFEDTDLGYRLFKRNKKFSLSPLFVYHQTTVDKTFGRPRDFLFKQKQLYKTGKIFFQRHLDPEIYKELKVYMRGYHSA